MTVIRKASSQWLLIALAAIAMVACDRNMVYEEIKDIPHNEWQANDSLVFQLPVSDTISVQNILFTIRNSSGYRYANLFLFVTTTSPKGALVRDTLEVPLADNQGKWYGKGISNFYDLRYPYRMMIKFPFPGTYTISVVQGMREKSLEGIAKFGVRVEKVND
ncbi:MAG TPA: gliding motility lipoprotein GldH [Williamwhitmania sp.]|nr:gliding motility lipoprotein GldH [Williamwhitmania sp.]